MITFSEAINKFNGLKYISDKLDIKTSLGKQHFLSQKYFCNVIDIDYELNNLETLINIIRNENLNKIIESIKIKLEQIHNIKGTINNLKKLHILDDIELFEIKKFCILADEVKKYFEILNFKKVKIHQLVQVIEILDPENQKIPHFYIYSSYSQELTEIRNQIKKQENQDIEKVEILKQKSFRIEDKIRKELTNQLFNYVDIIDESLNQIAYLDILLAKAEYCSKNNFCRPQISNQNSKFIEIYNPQVKELLYNEKKEFQPIDIELYKSVCLITGVNMGGKTLLLKTLSLIQYLFQFGFFVPAKYAEIVPVNEILLLIDDQQSELKGLSSFAAEIINLNEIIKKAKIDNNILVFIDELARTTNPEEGKAIVCATIDILEKYKIRSIITTHYSGLLTSCRKLKIKGIMFENINEKITQNNINNFMDYSLSDNNSNIESMKALKIAEILELDSELLEKAENYFLTPEK